MQREAHDTEGESVALVQLATVEYNSGRFGAARESLEKALPIVVASGFRYREAIVVSNLAAIVIQHGELGAGRRLITRGLELCIDLEDREGIATARNILGDIYRRAGMIDAAERELVESLSASTSSGFDRVKSDTLLSLALVAMERGRYDEALAHADEAIERGRAVDSPLAVARALVGRGYVLLADDRVREAGIALREALAAAERLDLAFLIVETQAALARVALLTGDRDEALAMAAAVLDCLDRPDLIGAIEPSEICRTCWRVFAECGDQRAADALTAARRFVDDMIGRIDEDELRESFRLVAANAEIAAGQAAERPDAG
jgi:tetratricopeptide (TPR) repeat protein